MVLLVEAGNCWSTYTPPGLRACLGRDLGFHTFGMVPRLTGATMQRHQRKVTELGF